MLTETKTLKEVSHLIGENSFQVKWRNTIEKDGEAISSTDHYKLFTQDQKAEFEAEVEGAASYVQAIGW